VRIYAALSSASFVFVQIAKTHYRLNTLALDKISRDSGLHVGFVKMSSETPMEDGSEDHSPAENSHRELLLSIVTDMQSLMCQGYFFIDVEATSLYVSHRYRQYRNGGFVIV
jgi:hypothetical protein